MRLTLIAITILALLAMSASAVAGPGKWKGLDKRETGVKKVKLKGKRRDIKRSSVAVTTPKSAFTLYGKKYAK